MPDTLHDVGARRSSVVTAESPFLVRRWSRS